MMCCYSCRVVMMIVMLVGVVCGWYRLYLCGVIHGVCVRVCLCVRVFVCQCVGVSLCVCLCECLLNVLVTRVDNSLNR